MGLAYVLSLEAKLLKPQGCEQEPSRSIVRSGWVVEVRFICDLVSALRCPGSWFSLDVMMHPVGTGQIMVRIVTAIISRLVVRHSTAEFLDHLYT